MHNNLKVKDLTGRPQVSIKHPSEASIRVFEAFSTDPQIPYRKRLATISFELARFVRDDEVAGSNPVTPTIFGSARGGYGYGFACPP